MRAFASAIARGPAFNSSWTRPSTAASRSASGTAARTRPISRARTASNRSPVRNSSRAADGGQVEQRLAQLGDHQAVESVPGGGPIQPDPRHRAVELHLNALEVHARQYATGPRRAASQGPIAAVGGW